MSVRSSKFTLIRYENAEVLENPQGVMILHVHCNFSKYSIFNVLINQKASLTP